MGNTTDLIVSRKGSDVGARIDIEQAMLTDPRFTIMAHQTQVDTPSALGRMAAVWIYCCDKETYTVSIETFNALYGQPFSHIAAVNAGLASWSDEQLRVNDLEGRIEWLQNCRKNAKAGGRARARQLATKSTNDSGNIVPQSSLPIPSPILNTFNTHVPDTNFELAEYLSHAISSHYPDHRPTSSQLRGWAKDIDKAIRLDGRQPESLKKVIDWAHRSPEGAFWRKNILSGATLRKQYDRLAIEITTKSQPSKPSLAPSPYRKFTAEDLYGDESPGSKSVSGVFPGGKK